MNDIPHDTEAKTSDLIPKHIYYAGFIEFFNNHNAWADRTFGKGKGPLPALKHLKEEVEELLESPHDRFEYADALFLIVNAAHNAGYTPLQLLEAAEEKEQINERRKWGEPNEHGYCKHVE